MYTIVGLGNPGEEYVLTRHNTGRLALEEVEKREIDKLKIIHLDTFMNKSGVGVAKAVKSQKAAQKLIVIYDDLDLPFGTVRISYDRGSGGHKGIDSIITALKTREFIRIRIGIGPTSPRLGGTSKKGDVEKHILGKFTPKEREELKKVFKKAADAVETIVSEGLDKAMTEFNKAA